jgi:WbqC-like protein family
VTVGIHQPHYLPWLRYFEKILHSDVFIVLDDIQYEKNGYQNRNKIKTAQGPLTLTVPVRRPTLRPIRDIEIDNATGWANRHRRALEMNYGKAPHFERYWPEVSAIYEREWTHLAALNRAMFDLFLRQLEIETPVLFSSEIPTRGQATQRLVELCRAAGCDTYLSGAYAVQTYLEPELLASAGITLAFQKWEAPTYTQSYPGGGFLADLAIVDLLFNEGPRAREILDAAGGMTLAGLKTERAA